MQTPPDPFSGRARNLRRPYIGPPTTLTAYLQTGYSGHKISPELKPSILAYQKALMPWFFDVLAKTSNFPLDVQRTFITTAEAYLRDWQIDPIEYYKAVATQLGVNPSDISPSPLAQGISVTAPTNLQIATDKVVSTLPQVTPAPVITQPAPAPTQIYTPDTSATPAIQNGITASLAPAPTPPTTPVAPTAPGAIDWGKWAMPLAVFGAALISVLNKGENHASD